MQKKLIMDQAQLDEYRAITEAVLFASDAPLSLTELSRIMDDVGEDLVGECIEALNEKYAQGGHGFEIRHVADGYQLSSKVDYAKWIRRLYRGRIPSRLNQGRPGMPFDRRVQTADQPVRGGGHSRGERRRCASDAAGSEPYSHRRPRRRRSAGRFSMRRPVISSGISGSTSYRTCPSWTN